MSQDLRLDTDVEPSLASRQAITAKAPGRASDAGLNGAVVHDDGPTRTWRHHPPAPLAFSQP